MDLEVGTEYAGPLPDPSSHSISWMTVMINSTLFQEDVLATIELAIRNQQVIQIKLRNIWRTLEPYQIGYPKGGQKNLTVYGYCRDIVVDALTPSRWQLFQLDQIQEIDLTAYCFQPHLSYAEQDQLMYPIFCQLSLLGGGLRRPTGKSA